MGKTVDSQPPLGNQPSWTSSASLLSSLRTASSVCITKYNILRILYLYVCVCVLLNHVQTTGLIDLEFYSFRASGWHIRLFSFRNSIRALPHWPWKLHQHSVIYTTLNTWLSHQMVNSFLIAYKIHLKTHSNSDSKFLCVGNFQKWFGWCNEHKTKYTLYKKQYPFQSHFVTQHSQTKKCIEKQ